MKLLLITPFYPAHGGGVEIVAHKIALELCRQGVSVLWCASNIDPTPTLSPNLQCLPYKASNIVEAKLSLPFPIPGLQALVTIYKAIANADIVHLHDYLYAPNIFAWLVAKIKNKPIIITQHIGMVPYQNRLFRHTLQLLNSILGKFMLTRTRHTIFISDHVKHYFESMTSTHPKQWCLIPNGVDSTLFKPGSSSHPSYILFVGRFVEKKGLLFLKQLVSHVQDHTWYFVGRGPINPNQWNLPNIKVIDHVDQNELVSLYQNAHLLVLPSVGEGFPLVIQEAMACGTPVLTTDETASGSAAASPLIHSLPINSSSAVTEWSSKIREILRAPRASAELSNFADSQWSWDSVGQHYLQLLQNIRKKTT